MEKKNVIFLTVLAVATLLTAVVGTTFAYFTAQVTNTNTPTATSITTATLLGIQYEDGEKITANNIVPGWATTKTIKITNTSAASVDYSISWASINNVIAAQQASGATDDFVYSIVKKTVSGSETTYTNVFTEDLATTKVITGEENLAKVADMAYSNANNTAISNVDASTLGTTAYNVKAVPSAAGEIFRSTLASGASEEYVITLMFLETLENQDNYSGAKTFSGTLKADIITGDGVQSETINP